jgi:hypothetical protein
MPSRLSNSEPADLDIIIVVLSTVVAIESEINHLPLPRTGDDLPDGGEVIVIGIRRFCLQEVGGVTG